MAKDASGRYATAQELSDDLKRFLNDDPIMGRRPGALERTLRWARRRRELVATATAILLISLVIGSFTTWRQARETVAARNKYRDYHVNHFAILDKAATNQVREASTILHSDADTDKKRRAYQSYDEVLKLFQDASELPPTDNESRIIDARALCRLATTRTQLSLERKVGDQPEPRMMAQAGSEFRRSIALFEKLLEECPGDRVIRRYYADSLGLFGMGCYLRFTHCEKDAEHFYRRAIELRRDLVRGIDPGGAAGPPPRLDDPDEREDVVRLIETVQVVSSMMEDSGRGAQGESLQRQLEADFVAVAARYSGSDFAELRRFWANEIAACPPMSKTERGRRLAAYRNSRFATILDPENATANNNIAWALVSAPDDPLFDPEEGLARAKKATDLNSIGWENWNTLGVAAFRAREWTTAHEALKKSIDITGGKAHDWFFLAMIHWNQGHRGEARQYFDLAVAAMKNDSKDDPELRRFHAEAAALMGLACPEPEVGVARKGSKTPKTLQN